MSIRTTILFLFTVSALASAAPDWKRDLTPAAAGDHPRLDPVALDYQVSWKGILNSGWLHMEFAPPGDKKAGAYVVKAHAVSQGAAAQLHPYQFDSWSELNPSNLAARFVRAAETDKNGKEVNIVQYFNNRVETATSYTSAETGKTNNGDRTFASGPVFDIFSAMLHVRSQSLADGDQINILIQSTDQPYILRVHCIGREWHNDQNTIKLSVGMQKIDRDTFELKPYKKLKRDATLWLSDDYDRVPIELRADIFLGDVRAILTQRKKF